MTKPAPALSCDEIKALVRTIHDFPEPGIAFRDITSLLAHGEGLAATIEHLTDLAARADAQAIAGIEARGFVFGAAVAARLGIGFIPVRKPGKLPVETIGVDYALEYGTDRLELDPGAIAQGQRIVLLDDLIATGGTAMAAAALLRQAGAQVDHAHFVIDLPNLGGARALRSADIEVASLMAFDGA